MSTLQVANIWFESTGNNRIQYAGSNSYVVVAGGANVVTVTTSGIKFSDTTTLNSAISGFYNLQVFTANGTFTVPTGVTKVKATVIGGGGGSSTGGAGGGGGGAAIKIISGLTPAATVTVTVGLGGAVDGTGGTSSFGAYCSATGGSNTALGGIGSSGDLNIRGGAGVQNAAYGGAGGSSIYGGGGSGGVTTGGTYGGGAYGGPTTGYLGGVGVVIVEY